MLRTLAIAAALLVPGLCLAQAQPQEARPTEDRAEMRQRLERRLADLDRIRGRLEGAIKQLDEGAPLETVRENVLPPESRRGERGPREPGDDRGDRPDHPPSGLGMVRHDVYGPPDPDAERRMVLRFLDEHDPAGAQRMRDVLRDHPEDGARWLGRSAARIRVILEERDDQLRGLRIQEYRIGRQAIEAARSLGDALAAQPPNAAAAESARTDLSRVLGEQFDIRLKLHEREIAVLDERIRRLKEDLAQQQGQRDKYVTDRTEEILRRTREWSERDRNRSPGGAAPQR